MSQHVMSEDLSFNGNDYMLILDIIEFLRTSHVHNCSEIRIYLSNPNTKTVVQKCLSNLIVTRPTDSAETNREIYNSCVRTFLTKIIHPHSYTYVRKLCLNMKYPIVFGY